MQQITLSRAGRTEPPRVCCGMGASLSVSADACWFGHQRSCQSVALLAVLASWSRHAAKDVELELVGMPQRGLL